MQIEKEYLPSVEDQVSIIKTQIAETQRIIFRSYLEWVEGNEKKDDQTMTSSEFNVRTLKKKIDILEEELGKL